MQTLIRRLNRPQIVNFSVVVVLTALFLFSGLMYPDAVRSQESSNTGDALVSPESMRTARENALTGQQADLTELKARMQQLDTLQKAIRTEIDAYDSQNAAHAQLLLVPQLRIEDLETALKNNRLALRTLDERIKTFQERWDSTSILQQHVTDRIELARTQMADIKQTNFPADQQRNLETATRKLLEVLQEKKKLGERYLKICGALLDQMKVAQAEKLAIGEKLTIQLASRQKASLFKRSDPFHRLSGKALGDELLYFWSRIQAVFSPAVWKAQWAQVKMGGVARWGIFLAVLSVILVLQGRSKLFLKGIENKCKGPERYYRGLELYLLRQSLLYFSMTLLFGIHSSLQFSLLNIGLGRLLFFVFLFLLLTSWGMDYLKHGSRRSPTNLRTFVTRHLKRFFRVFRISALISLLLIWIVGRDSLLPWLLGNLFTAVYLTWAWVFWRQMKPVVAEGVREGQAAPNPKWIVLLQGWLYLVFGGSLLLSLIGYGFLANQWLFIWIKMVALLFWGWISLNAIREWRREHFATTAADGDQPRTLAYEWRWLQIQLVWSAWVIGLTAGLLWALDSSGFLKAELGVLFNLTLTVGSLNLSIKGVILAAVILFITHAAVRIGRTLLDEKVLNERSLEQGLKDSILTITKYLAWGLGLLLALGILGVNATSLAVVFGALSIGIGFGLQNIFNNFISGLILLFERPIQVGDIVEVGGLWATVKQINVRATVVQTFDNASVIIPNSEFISQQVTNWSFKDKRMRRNLEVGVAYGSDIELVEQTLLDIVQNRRRVLQYPKPEVLFMDHADSALIFRLRFWVHVDDYWAVPSKIRFDIDRRFRELGIEIAFPQRDLHVRTIPKDIAPVVSPSSPIDEKSSGPDQGER